MSKEFNATCAICGSKYKVCFTCKNTKILTPWRTITDEIECYKIYMIIHDYTNGKLTKEKAYEMLKERIIPAKLQDHVKAVIGEIMGTNKNTKTESRKKVLEKNATNNE